MPWIQEDCGSGCHDDTGENFICVFPFCPIMSCFCLLANVMQGLSSEWWRVQSSSSPAAWSHTCMLAVIVSTATRKIKAKTESKEQTGPLQSRRRRKGKTTSNQVRLNTNSCSLHTSQRDGPCLLEPLETRSVSSSLDLIVYRGCFLYIDMNRGLHTLIWIEDSSGLIVCCGIMRDAVFSFSLWVC